jgi:hypothetical protein
MEAYITKIKLINQKRYLLNSKNHSFYFKILEGKFKRQRTVKNSMVEATKTPNFNKITLKQKREDLLYQKISNFMKYH